MRYGTETLIPNKKIGRYMVSKVDFVDIEETDRVIDEKLLLDNVQQQYFNCAKEEMKTNNIRNEYIAAFLELKFEEMRNEKHK